MSKTRKHNTIEKELVAQRSQGMFPRAKAWSRKGDPKRIKKERRQARQDIRTYL